MSVIAQGTFVVEPEPPIPPTEVDGATLGRMRLRKRFSGDFVGTSTVEMLTAITSVKGSAGYVAMEHLRGTLHGHEGTFVCQHDGQMNRGTPRLAISIVPDSGTGALTGIGGTVDIDIVDGEHRYRMDVELVRG